MTSEKSTSDDEPDSLELVGLVSDETPDVRESAVKPCAECPWMRSNLDRAAPERWASAFTQESRAFLWRLHGRHGNTHLCHLAMGDEAYPMRDPEWKSAGFATRAADASLPWECAGAAAVQVAELRRIKRAGSYLAYLALFPYGMTPAGARRAAARFTGALPPRLRERFAIADDELVNPHEGMTQAPDAHDPHTRQEDE